MESAKQELATIAAAKTLREEADKASQAKIAADILANNMVQTAVKAASDSTDAAARSAADPHNTVLKDEVDAKAKAAALAKQASDEASTLATAVTTKAQTVEVAARKAEAVAEAAKSNVASVSVNAAALSGSSLTVNTNLEQISDWLTKIIVGVSLVESQTLLNKMRDAASFMAKSIAKADEMVVLAVSAPSSTATAAAESASATALSASAAAVATANSLELLPSSPMASFAYALMLYFLVTGLLGSYLLTRLFLQRALNNAARQHATPVMP